ncbi:MAG TPA: MarR family transcriptional regulator [Mycobacteriales bacterium]|jgi:DNA-binding MarR family transcriptional regulator|nr:MarR family transcriptional regulator [Mycobacteriales bacterium]
MVLPFDPIAEAARQWEHRFGPAGDMAAVTSVMRVQQLLQAAVDRALKPFELSFARYEALVLLTFARSGALPMSAMGERLMLHPASVTGIVDRLERDGLVARSAHPTDRRTTLVSLTGNGVEVVGAATNALTAMRFGLRGTPPEAVQQLTELLRALRHEAGDLPAAVAVAD